MAIIKRVFIDQSTASFMSSGLISLALLSISTSVNSPARKFLFLSIKARNTFNTALRFLSGKISRLFFRKLFNKPSTPPTFRKVSRLKP